MRRALLAWLLLHGAALGCDRPKPLAPEPQAAPVVVPVAAAAQPSAAPAPGRAESAGAPDPRLPVVGDPLGLLSRPPAPEPARSASAQARSTSFDPGALMANAALEPPTRVEIERDPRAVARGQGELVEPRPRAAASDQARVTVQEKGASALLAGLRGGLGRPHVLYLYASYCKACRNVLPSFLELVRVYRARGVQFTAASVDRHAEQFAEYAPALGGVLPALWIKPEGPGVTLRELRRAGLSLPEDWFAIPLFAVFDSAHRLVSQGNTRELPRLPETLDALL